MPVAFVREGKMTELEDAATEAAERKRMDRIWWGGVLIWIGLALAATYANILPDVGDTGEWWPWIFIGVGPWSLVLNLYRQASDSPDPKTWDWIWTAVFLLVALGTFVDISGEIVGSIVLVAIGLIMLTRALRRSE